MLVAHPRKLIRDAVVAALTGATAAGTRVKGTRVEPQRNTQLPAIGVYTLSEEVDAQSAGTAPRELTRDLKLEVAGWVADSSALPVDDAMDALAEQIEVAMDADRYFGDTAANSILQSTEMSVLEENAADPLIGIVKLTYTVTYRNFAGVTSPADDFDRAGVTTKRDGAGDNNTISDLVEVPGASP